MLFIPFEGTWTMDGEANPNGIVEGSRSTVGADKKSYDTRFDGTWTRSAVEGNYVTPRCTFAFVAKAS